MVSRSAMRVRWSWLAIGSFLAMDSGCAAMQNTLQQDYVWAMWDRCKTGSASTLNVFVSRVEADGRFWLTSTGGPSEAEIPRAAACMREEFQKLSYADWLRSEPIDVVSKENGPASGTGGESIDRSKAQSLRGIGTGDEPSVAGNSRSILWKWDDSTIPGPAQVEIVRPKEAVPIRVAGFSGAWSGAWDGLLRSRLVVEFLDTESALVVYAWENDQWNRFRGGWVRVRGLVSSDGVLSWGDGPTFVFRLRGNGTGLDGQRREGGKVSEIQMRKIAP
jgi:hypothetical protein